MRERAAEFGNSHSGAIKIDQNFSQRHNLSGPGFSDVDLSVFKTTQIHIHDFPVSLQFRAEMYNLLNRINLASPSCNQLCSDFWDGSSDFGGAFGSTSPTIGSGNYPPGIGPGEPFNTQLSLKMIL